MVDIRSTWNVAEDLAAIERNGLQRRMRTIDGAQSAELVVDGRRVANFSSNNYLGLADSPLLRDAAIRAMHEHGFGAGASRLIVGNLSPHRALEARIARWKRTEAALLFNSGYHANLGVISALLGADDLVFSDELNHASIIDGCRLSRAHVVVYPHRDLDALRRALADYVGRRRLVISDSIFSMDGDRADVAALAAIAREHGAMLAIDEAHGAGIIDDNTPVDLRIGTLGKALGSFGAYVAASAPLIDLLAQRARSFVFTTALPVPVVAAAHAAIDWLATDDGRARLEALAENCRYFHARRQQSGAPSHIVPLLVRDGDPRRAMAACEALLERGIFVQGIRPPTVPAGSSRLRFALMATHTRAQLDHALAALDDLRDHFA
ncbi:MAG TPA: 8-amino-7-oxononanoate synthase [Polyangia bacterium]|jgi:glycine C-acetyltransferase|nr:8-amino-7-oxononanoate synthase [Polyangia bacterium]